MEISKDELTQAVQAVISRDDVPEKYVRDFINYSAIDGTVNLKPLEKLSLVYTYGSRRAKQITVDEKLKFR
jgi:hypothetical protein